jgi:hypothetical protein
MGRLLSKIVLVVLLAALVSSCSLATGIFKAGVWVGVILVVLVVGTLFALFARRG